MMRFLKWAVSFLLILTFNAANTQNFIAPLEKWSSSHPIEKTYLHLDRETYFAGQTVWFKAYFLSDFLPSSKNSTLFVELLNNQSGTIFKKVLPVFGALSYGQIDLPDSLSTGSYQLRAYTPLMLNFDKNYLFSRRITIYGRNKTRSVTKSSAAITLQFFPEGGNLVAGLTNNIAFKATDGNGLPVNVSGTIKNKDGKTVANFNTRHDGMGTFQLTPEPGGSYHAHLSGTDGTNEYALPEANETGVALKVANNSGGKSFSLQYRGNQFQPAYLVGQMQHNIVMKQPLSFRNNDIVKGTIQTKELPSGVLQLTIFNKDGMPLAERLSFINNKEYILPASLQTDTFNTGVRKKNHFTITIPDSITGNFSVSVTDADYEAQSYRPQNIISSFLLTSDIAGYVNNPAYYFGSSAADDIELVMLTNGWRRFKWTDVVNNTLPVPEHKDPGFISLSGKVDIKGSNQSFADRDLLVWVATDSGRTMQMVKTDAEGHFKMDSMIFFDKARVLFSDVMGKKSKFITVKLNADSLYKTYSLPPLHIPYIPYSTSTDILASKMTTAYYDYNRGEGVMLDSVVVLGTQTRLQRLEEKYMSGLFAGGINSRTIDLTREFVPQMNIFDYLNGRIPSLTIERGGFGVNYRLYYRQSGNRTPMALYLDEMPTDADMISSIPPNQIALVKVFPNFVGAPGGGAGGVLAIYTKRGDDLNDAMSSSTDIVDYQGYSIIKEFYAPDYTTEAENRYNDYRLTLDWKPELFVSGQSPKIPVIFYNNDRTKKFKFVAEGITSTGKLLMIEKNIESNRSLNPVN